MKVFVNNLDKFEDMKLAMLWHEFNVFKKILCYFSCH